VLRCQTQHRHLHVLLTRDRPGTAKAATTRLSLYRSAELSIGLCALRVVSRGDPVALFVQQAVVLVDDYFAGLDGVVARLDLVVALHVYVLVLDLALNFAPKLVKMSRNPPYFWYRGKYLEFSLGISRQSLHEVDA
jgi:hypothetical protein